MNRTVVRHVLVASFALLFATTPAAAPKRPPKMPSSPTPANGATGVPTQVTLKCTSEWATQFELYFDTETVKTASGCGFLVYTAAGTSHQWRIRSSNRYGFVDGPVWTFATVAATPVPEPTPTPPAPTPTPLPDPSTSTGYGPTSLITCPSSSVLMAAGSNIQSAVDANPSGTTFCLSAGVTTIRGSIRPKSGDVFVGQFGAVLDGTGWSTTDTTHGAFRAWNEDIDDVTVRNLVIRNVPMGGVTAFRDSADRWTVEYVEIGPCGGTGINLPHSGLARRLYVHDCRVGGYAAYLSNNTRWEDNDFARNGNESKLSLTAGTVMLRNFIHHNINGLWLDGENIDWLLEGNRIEDNLGDGIYIEVSGRGVARNNYVRRNGGNGINASLSHDVQFVGNVLENNAHGIVYFVDCSRVGSSEGNYQYPGHISVPFAMGNITSTGNTITVGTQPGAFANGFSYTTCSQAQLDAYLNGSMGLTFSGNSYVVPSMSGAYWLWNGMKTWSQWQALGKDVTGSVRQP